MCVAPGDGDVANEVNHQKNLRLFDFLWSSVWCLQLCKEVRIAQKKGRPNAVGMVLVGCLTLSIAVCLWSSALPRQRQRRRSTQRIVLALSGLLYMLVRGSSSNHVVLQCLLCCLVLETWVLSTSIQRNSRRLLGALFFVTAVAKCNSGFLNPRESCAMLYAVAGGATTGLQLPVLNAMPALAIVVEFWLASAFWFWENFGLRTKKAVVFTGFLFHCGLAAPLPPLSVYPFSLAMAPFFALATLPDDVPSDHEDDVDISALLIGALVFPAIYSATLLVDLDLFEYPPYGSWHIGIAWCCAAFTAVIARPFLYDKKRFNEATTSKRSYVATSLMFLVGALPYVGVRTHPAFIMFSNLRIEASSNHWLFTDAVLRRIALSSAARDVATIVQAENFPDVVSMRVDLSPWIQHKDRIAQATSTEFLISPPAHHWHLGPANLEKPFAVPFLELRRRVTTSLRSNSATPFLLVYERRGTTSRLQRFHNGTLVADDDIILKPLPFWSSVLSRFRAFDHDHSPCRH